MMDLMSFMESMGSSNIPLIAAFFIGLMNSISPCTLTTNITAVAYVSKRVGNEKNALLTGVMYALGRMLAYTAIASGIVYLGLEIQFISIFLQEYGYVLLGPFLVLTGLLMLGHINLGFLSAPTPSRKLQERLSRNGYIGGFLLGMVFSLAFCPISASFFFLMLIPLAIETGDAVILPAVFGLGTVLPVLFLSLILVVSAHRLGEAMHMMRIIEIWTRRITAVIFILAGAYLILQTLGLTTGIL